MENTQTVIVIESPNKIHTIHQLVQNNPNLWPTLGINNINELKVVSTMGHFMGLDYSNDKKGFTIINNTVSPLYAFKDQPTKTRIMQTIKPPLLAASNIFIATDNDNEGELIGNEVQMLLSSQEWRHKNLSRIRITEITPSGLTRAIANKEPQLNVNMINSAIGRGIWDLEFGFTLSNLLREEIKKTYQTPVILPNQKQYGANFVFANKLTLKHLGSGRVKAYILEEIGNRCEAIRTYTEKTWYTLNPIVNNLVFNHIATGLNYATVNNSTISFPNVNYATQAMQDIGNQVKCSNISGIRHTISKLAEPLVLSDVPIANLSNGITTQLEVSQFLFEAGLTTYPRSKYRTVSPDFVNTSLPLWNDFLVKTQYPKIPGLDKQVWAIKPDNKFIAGTSENIAYLQKQEKQAKKNAKNQPTGDLNPSNEPENAHECYRVTDLILDNVGMLSKCIEHKVHLGENQYDRINSLLSTESSFINSNDTISQLISKYPNLTNELWFLNDCLKFYSYVRNGTRKIFTNPPEYDKSDITLQSKKSTSDLFKANLSQKTVLGYDYVDKINKNEEKTEENSENSTDETNSNNLNSLLNAFVLNNDYIISNFNVLNPTDNLSVIKKRTTTKPHFLTEGEVISLLEKNNIGTEATRANTLKQMGTKERGILDRTKLKQGGYGLNLTDLGYVVWYETRTKCPDVVKKEWTAKFDEKISDIEEGSYSKDELILALIEEMNKQPYAPYNWFNPTSSYTSMPKPEITPTDTNCIFCNEPMYTNGLSVFCKNEQCPSTTPTDYAKYKRAWGYLLASVIPNSFCPNHPSISMLLSKNKKPYCPIDMLIATMPGLAYLKDSIKPKAPSYIDSHIPCPACGVSMAQSDKRIVCINRECPLDYNEMYKQVWGINIKDIVRNEFCPLHPTIPMVKSSKGNRTYCPYEAFLFIREKNSGNK